MRHVGFRQPFLELQVVDEVYDRHAPRSWLSENTVTIMIHPAPAVWATKSATTPSAKCATCPPNWASNYPTASCLCPVHSSAGARYLGPCAAPPISPGQPQILMHLPPDHRRVIGRPAERLGMHLIYDVAHNIAKMETYDVDGEPASCASTARRHRAFPAGHPTCPTNTAASAAGDYPRRHGHLQLRLVGQPAP